MNATSVSPVLGSRRRGRARTHWAVYVVLTVLALFAIGPIVLFFFNALKTQDELGANPLGLPSSWHWSNFAEAWDRANMGAGVVNSAIVVSLTVVITCIVASLAAYGLARLDVRGGGVFMAYLLVAGSLPAQLFLVPLFYMWTSVGLYDSLFGLALIYVGLFSPIATLLLRSFLLTLPRGFEEAARIDGANEFVVFARIVMPNALPGLLTVALVTGLSAYNEFLFAVTFLQDNDLFPLSTTFFAFQQGFARDFTLISAAGIIMIAPMLVLFLVLQRRFVEGMSATGMGGA